MLSLSLVLVDPGIPGLPSKTCAIGMCVIYLTSDDVSGMFEGGQHVSVLTLGIIPPLVFVGDGHTADEADDCAAQAAVKSLTASGVSPVSAYNLYM